MLALSNKQYTLKYPLLLSIIQTVLCYYFDITVIKNVTCCLVSLKINVNTARMLNFFSKKRE